MIVDCTVLPIVQHFSSFLPKRASSHDDYFDCQLNLWKLSARSSFVHYLRTPPSLPIWSLSAGPCRRRDWCFNGIDFNWTFNRALPKKEPLFDRKGRERGENENKKQNVPFERKLWNVKSKLSIVNPRKAGEQSERSRDVDFYSLHKIKEITVSISNAEHSNVVVIRWISEIRQKNKFARQGSDEIEVTIRVSVMIYCRRWLAAVHVSFHICERYDSYFLGNNVTKWGSWHNFRDVDSLRIQSPLASMIYRLYR